MLAFCHFLRMIEKRLRQFRRSSCVRTSPAPAVGVEYSVVCLSLQQKAAWLEEFALAVKIRLARHGSKKRPYYRVVVADARSPRDGRFIEEVGRYNPLTTPKTISLDLEKIADWQVKGAQLTDAVAALVKAANEGEKAAAEPKKSKKQLAKEAKAAEEAAAAAAEASEE